MKRLLFTVLTFVLAVVGCGDRGIGSSKQQDSRLYGKWLIPDCGGIVRPDGLEVRTDETWEFDVYKISVARVGFEYLPGSDTIRIDVKFDIRSWYTSSGEIFYTDTLPLQTPVSYEHAIGYAFDEEGSFIFTNERWRVVGDKEWMYPNVGCGYCGRTAIRL